MEAWLACACASDAPPYARAVAAPCCPRCTVDRGGTGGVCRFTEGCAVAATTPGRPRMQLIRSPGLLSGRMPRAPARRYSSYSNNARLVTRLGLEPRTH